MSTLEDAAEELVVKLRGLDAEIEESRSALEQLRDGVEDVSEEVEREWTALAAAATSLLEKLRDEHEKLGQQMQETLQAAGDAQQSVQDAATEARTEIAEGRAQLDTLAQHAAGLEPGVDALAAEAGEAPARSLAERAAEIEQELGRLLDEARTFLEDDVVGGLDKLTSDIRERGEALHRSLAEEGPAVLKEVFDDWEKKVDELETSVATQAFATSHENAREYVEWAVDECRGAIEEQLDGLHQLAQVLEGQLKELAAEVQRSGDAVVDQSGKALVADLDTTGPAVAGALQALEAVRDLLAQHSFLET